MKKVKNRLTNTKIIDERCLISRKKGGGIIRVEAWEDDHGNVINYSMAYINHLIFAGDNGRVIGYDNAHGYHHRHCCGETFPVRDFTTYEELLDRFEKEAKEGDRPPRIRCGSNLRI